MSTPFCAICLADIDGIPAREPLGRGGALVNVCHACADEHPRLGRYGFDDAAKHPTVTHAGYGGDRRGHISSRKGSRL